MKFYIFIKGKDMKLPRLNNIVLLLLALFTLASCEDDVTDLRNLDLSPRLVVNSYISPQDTELKVQLQTTQPGIGHSKTPEQRQVRDATVTLSDGSTTVALAYDPITDLYKTGAENMPVVAGKTYFLKVSTRSGFHAEASCTVPAVNGIALSDLNHKFAVPEWNPQSREHHFSYKWTDAPNTVNYYRSMAYVVVKFTDPNGNRQALTQVFYQDDETKSFFSDEKAAGETVKSPDFYTYALDAMGGPGETEFEVHALLIVSDRNFFLYHQSVVNQSRTEGNPFAEPIFIYSNIQGGLGVFGAFNEIDASVTVK